MSGEHEKTEEINKIERLRPQQLHTVTEELTAILSMLRAVCPADAVINFDFDGKLHVHIDVRKLEDLQKVEALLPRLAGGMFQDLTRGQAVHHPFFHRLSAAVNR